MSVSFFHFLATLHCITFHSNSFLPFSLLPVIHSQLVQKYKHGRNGCTISFLPLFPSVFFLFHSFYFLSLSLHFSFSLFPFFLPFVTNVRNHDDCKNEFSGSESKSKQSGFLGYFLLDEDMLWIRNFCDTRHDFLSSMSSLSLSLSMPECFSLSRKVHLISF